MDRRRGLSARTSSQPLCRLPLRSNRVAPGVCTGHDDRQENLNWKLYARNDKLYVKQYDAETNLDCHLVVDVSTSDRDAERLASRNGGTRPCWRQRSRTWLLTQHDAVGVTLFAEKVLCPHQAKAPRPTSSRKFLGRSCGVPEKTPAASAAGLQAHSRRAHARRRASSY